MRPAAPAPRLAALVTLVAVAACGLAWADGLRYPRLGLYATVGPSKHKFGFATNAAPFYDAQDRLIDSVVTWHARFHEVVLDAGPVLDRPEIVRAIKAKSPTTRVVGLIDGSALYYQPLNSPRFPDTTGSAVLAEWHSVTRNPGWWTRSAVCPGDWYNPFRSRVPGHPCDARRGFSWFNVNLADRATCDSLADVTWRVVIRPGLFDGLFIDLLFPHVGWSQGADSLAMRAMGYPSAASYDSAWHDGVLHVLVRLRALAPPRFTIAVNAVDPAFGAYVNGSMREGFPRQSGGTWSTNLENWSAAGTGMLREDTSDVQPHEGWLNSVCSPCSDYQGGDNPRLVRFGLGSACLAGGFHTISENDRPGTTPRWRAWYDEYAVDLETRTPALDTLYRGWLGRAAGPPRPWQGAWRRDFEFGVVLVNPTFAPVTLSLEQPFYHLRGTSPVNNGARADTVTVAAQDACFLARFDSYRGQHRDAPPRR